MPWKGAVNEVTDKAMTDEELIKYIGSIRAGDMFAFEQLSQQYRPLLVSTVNATLANGSISIGASDRDDLMQEALLALYKAACTYKEQDNVSFGLYAKICVRNSVYKAAEKLSRQNRSISDIDPVFEDTMDTDATPEECLLATEKAKEVHAFMENELTAYERKVFLLHLAQRTYAEIAESIGKDIKSVANAIARVRAKLRKLFD